MIFRFVVRTYFEREAERIKIDAAYFNCPTECPNAPKYFDANRRRQCDTCPHKLEYENLKCESEDLILQTVGRLDERYPFEKVLPTVYQIGALKELPPELMTVKTAEMAAVYRSEKHRIDAIKDAEQPK